MALVPNRKNWTATPLRRLVTAGACATLVGTSVAVAFPPNSSATGTMSADITVSTVEFVEAALDTDYATGGAVPEAVGDQQQIDDRSTEVDDAMNAYIARADVASDNVVVGATWEADAPRPAFVHLRYLEDGLWSEWIPLEVAGEAGVEDGVTGRQGTEPFTLTNGSAVEVVATGADGVRLPSLTLSVIDVEGHAPIDNTLVGAVTGSSEATDPETADQANTPAADATNGDGGAEANNPRTESDVESDDDALPSGDVLLDLDGAAAGDTTSAVGDVFSAAAGVLPTALNSAGTEYDTGFLGLVIKTRKAWGADESIRSGEIETIALKGAVVHHTQGSNTYTRDQVPGQIQGVYYYHAVTLGWGDIGYNLVVDKFGGVWEGRAGGLTKAIKGAQARGANSETFGITILGDYRFDPPPAVARQAMAKTIAWKLSIHGVSSATAPITIPGYYNSMAGNGKTIQVPTVMAHRDVGATDCPGDAFYARMGTVRQEVTDALASAAYQGQVTRLSGADRYETNLAVNRASTATGKPVFVVTGQDFADALSIGPAVSHMGGSLFLVRNGPMNNATLDLIASKKPSAIYVVGGAGVVPDTVISQLQATAAVTPVRVGGKDRYETSAAVLSTFFGDRVNSRVFIATGRDFPDALTAAAAGGALGAPVVLVDGRTGNLPVSAVDTLNSRPGSTTLLAVGGTGAITNEASQALLSAIDDSAMTRLSGATRYATNLAVNDYVTKNGGSSPTGVWLATGRDFPDALSAATPAGSTTQRLVLSPGPCIPPPVVSSWIAPSASTVSAVTLVGSSSVLSDEVQGLRECQ